MIIVVALIILAMTLPRAPAQQLTDATATYTLPPVPTSTYTMPPPFTLTPTKTATNTPMVYYVTATPTKARVKP